jgi:hypothetical protein
MAKKAKGKAAKKAKKSAKAAKRAPQRGARKAAKPAAKKAKKSAVKKSAATKASAKKAAKSNRAAKKASTTAAKSRRTTAPAQTSPTARQARKAAEPRTAAATGRRPNLDRERRIVREDEEMVPSPPSSLNMDRTASAARTGRAEFEQRLRNHTSTGPAMTGGDVDADWEDAEAVGDEAPGGDNPTPDQDIVDEIGKAMGIEYDDDEELQGGDELAARDRHRWELDPASKEDFEDE